jgi:SAM-dependent methyltransferase
MPQRFIVQKVLRTLESLPEFPRLNVLDLSCGDGEILARLAERGCAVQGTRYRTDDYILQRDRPPDRAPIAEGVDLAGRLPFDDAAFDVIILTEVLEHLESHGPVLRESGRVLRPGGRLVFTTPNVFRLHSRLQFFLTGKHKLIRRRVGWDLRTDDLYAYHIRPVDFPLVHALLHQADLTIERLGFTRFKFKSVFFLPLAPIVWLACRLTLDRDSRRNAVFRAGERDLNRWLSHPALLFSEQLFVVARRSVSNPGARRSGPP